MLDATRNVPLYYTQSRRQSATTSPYSGLISLYGCRCRFGNLRYGVWVLVGWVELFFGVGDDGGDGGVAGDVDGGAAHVEDAVDGDD